MRGGRGWVSWWRRGRQRKRSLRQGTRKRPRRRLSCLMGRSRSFQEWRLGTRRLGRQSWWGSCPWKQSLWRKQRQRQRRRWTRAPLASQTWGLKRMRRRARRRRRTPRRSQRLKRKRKQKQRRAQKQMQKPRQKPKQTRKHAQRLMQKRTQKPKRRRKQKQMKK